MLVNPNDLNLWIENNWNVLFTGRHGTGKTSIIIDAFNRHNLNWMYFSASTMDPWVDFIGVPKEMGENGQTYLGLVRPERFQKDEVEAIFFDELNRSAKKVRNAVLELIQFKSINGKKFNNLRMIWAAINPEDENEDDMNSLSYDVEPMDPAQKDRFQIQIDIPYKCDKTYFSKKYGKDLANVSIEWWDSLDDSQKKLISPRRLDYALNVHRKGGNIRHVIGKAANVSDLIKKISIGDIASFVKDLKNDKEKAEKCLSNRANFDLIRTELIKDENFEFFVVFFPKEEISNYLCDNTKIGKDFRNKFLKEDFLNKNDEMRKIIKDVVFTNRKNTKNDFKPILEELKKYSEIKKKIPKENVYLKNITDNVKDKIQKNIDYIETLSKFKTISPHLEYYKANGSSGTQYKKNFLNSLVRDFTFLMNEEECNCLCKCIFEIIASFQKNTIKNSNLQTAFILLIKTIEINKYINSSFLFENIMKNCNDSQKEKIKIIISETVNISEYDIDRFIEAESYNKNESKYGIEDIKRTLVFRHRNYYTPHLEYSE